MTVIVVLLYVLKVHRIGYARPLIQLAQITEQTGIIFQALEVTLEMAVINRVEAHQGGKQAPIGQGYLLAQQIPALREQLFKPVKGFEQVTTGLLIYGLLGGKARLVNAVVYIVVDTLVDFGHRIAQVGRGKIAGVAGQAVKGAVEQLDDLRRLVVDDGLLLGIPKHRHGNPAGVVGTGMGIKLVHVLIAIKRFGLGKGPALIKHMRVHNGHGNMRRQPLELAQNQRAVRPRARQRDIQMVATAVRRKAPARLNPIAKPGIFPLESTAGALGVIPLVNPASFYKTSHLAVSCCLAQVLARNTLP